MLKKMKVFFVALTAVSLLSGITALAAPGASFFSEPAEQILEPDMDSFKGYKVIPKVDITVTALGRDAFEMAQDHKVQVWDVTARPDPSVDIPWGEEEPHRIVYDGSFMMAEVLVTPNSPVDSGFHYEELDAPVVLEAGKLYAIVSEEFEDGDLVTYPPDNAQFIAGLVNEKIAYIPEDAHNSIPGGVTVDNPPDAIPPINYWFSTWSYDTEVMERGPVSTGILSSVNFWYVEDDAVIAANNAPDEIADDDIDNVDGNDDVIGIVEEIDEGIDNIEGNIDENDIDLAVDDTGEAIENSETDDIIDDASNIDDNSDSRDDSSSGDKKSSDIIPYIIIAAVAVVLLIAVVIFAKKKGKK